MFCLDKEPQDLRSFSPILVSVMTTISILIPAKSSRKLQERQEEVY